MFKGSQIWCVIPRDSVHCNVILLEFTCSGGIVGGLTEVGGTIPANTSQTKGISDSQLWFSHPALTHNQWSMTQLSVPPWESGWSSKCKKCFYLHHSRWTRRYVRRAITYVTLWICYYLLYTFEGTLTQILEKWYSCC